ncbi:MAG: biotin/lipoyl-containing protein [Actinomycetes bacterium]
MNLRADPESTQVRFPTLNAKDPAARGVVATWFVADGELVRTGQLIAEVAMDKVSAEVEAPCDGQVHLLAPAEQVVDQGSVIARVDPG